MPAIPPRAAAVGRALRARPWSVAFVALVVGHLVFVLTRRYVPGGDWAFIDLRTSDVFSRHTPLTGAWSRYGWNHPGPILYDALALPRLLVGGSWRGVWIGAMLLALAAAGVAIRLVEPFGRIATASWVVAITWTIAAATPLLFTDPWNASVVVLPLLTSAAAVVAVRSGDQRAVAVGIVVFVACAQTHAAYGVMLLPATLVVLAIGFVRYRRSTLRWLAVGAVLCLPVAIDTAVHWPGNLWRAFRFTLRSDEPTVALSEVARVLGRSSSLTAVWSPRLPSFVANVSGVPWGVAPFAAFLGLAVARVVARRRGWPAATHAVDAVALLWLGGALMTWRTRGPLLVWLTTWTVPVIALTWCVVAGVAVRWLVAVGVVDRVVGARRAAAASALTAMAATSFAAVNVAGSVGVGYPFHELTLTVEQFARAAGPWTGAPIAVDLDGDEYVAGAVQSALVARLDDQGAEVLGRPDQALQLGTRRVAPTLDTPHLLVQVEARTSPPVGSTQLSVVDPLGPAERAESDRLMDDLTGVLTDAGVPDRIELLANDLAPLAALDGPAEVTDRRADFERLGELHARGPRIVLYLIDPP